MLKQMFCKECNEPLDFSYVVPEKQFCITEGGIIERADNNLSDEPELVFYCSNDREHEIGDSKELNDWIENVSDKYYAGCVG